MDYAKLEEIGLTKWEARTYLGLLKLGSTTTGPLVKECSVPQSKIYGVLESLNKKGLVAWIIKGKIKYFQASAPEKIISIIKDREREISSLMPELKNLELSSKNKQSVEIFEGMKAITSLLVELIDKSKKGDEWLGCSAFEDDFLEKTQVLWRKIGILRYDARLKVKVLANIKLKNRYKTDYRDRWKWVRQIMRFSRSIFPATTIVFQGKIIILDFQSSPETAVVISSKNMFSYYREYFNQEFRNAKKV